MAGFCVAVFGFWKLYRNAYHSPFTIYKCDYSGFEDAYKLEFGFFEGGVQWRGWFTDEQRSASGQWKIGDDGFYHVRVSLLRTRLPENDGNNPAFRAVVEGPRDEVVGALQAVSGVVAADIRSWKGNRSTFVLWAEEEASDLEGRIGEVCRERRWALDDLSGATPDLEDLFVALTRGEGVGGYGS